MKRYILLLALISMQANVTLPIFDNLRSKASRFIGYFKTNFVKPKQQDRNYDELVELLRKRPLKKNETVYYNGDGYTVYDTSLPSYWSASSSDYALVRTVKFLDRFHLATEVIDITRNVGRYRDGIVYGDYIDIQHTRTYNIGKNGYTVFLGSAYVPFFR